MADYKILTIPFARDAVPEMVNDIPNDPSIVEPQLASFKQGFPSITTIPLVAGGIPPEGQDFNGILRDITEHIVHQNKGGMYKFAPEVVAAGGYPKGSVLAANDNLSLWVSLVDANVQDFNTGTPTQWARIAFSGLDALLNGKVDKASIVQVTGVSTTNVMSQKAVTDAISGFSLATQAEAEAGTNNSNYMSPLRVFQSLRSAAANATEALRGVLRVGTQAEVDAGVLDNVAVTPLKLRTYASALIGSGAIGYFAAAGAPPGWLKANGAAVSRTTYAALYASIGTSFGAGDGSTTFNLPDLRGEFLRGWDDGRGVDSGRVFGSGQADEFKAHDHRLRGCNGPDGPLTNNGITGGSGAFQGFTDTTNVESSGGVETRPRNIALLACIKY